MYRIEYVSAANRIVPPLLGFIQFQMFNKETQVYEIPIQAMTDATDGRISELEIMIRPMDIEMVLARRRGQERKLS